MKRDAILNEMSYCYHCYKQPAWWVISSGSLPDVIVLWYWYCIFALVNKILSLSSFHSPNNTTVCTFTMMQLRRAGQQGPTRTLTAALKRVIKQLHPFNGPFPGLPRWAGTLGQLSLASLRGRLIEYQLRLKQGRECHLCRVAGNTVWSHVACEFP